MSWSTGAGPAWHREGIISLGSSAWHREGIMPHATKQPCTVSNRGRFVRNPYPSKHPSLCPRHASPRHPHPDTRHTLPLPQGHRCRSTKTMATPSARVLTVAEGCIAPRGLPGGLDAAVAAVVPAAPLASGCGQRSQLPLAWAPAPAPQATPAAAAEPAGTSVAPGMAAAGAAPTPLPQVAVPSSLLPASRPPSLPDRRLSEMG